MRPPNESTREAITRILGAAGPNGLTVSGIESAGWPHLPQRNAIRTTLKRMSGVEQVGVRHARGGRPHLVWRAALGAVST